MEFCLKDNNEFNDNIINFYNFQLKANHKNTLFYGVTKEPIINDYMLIYNYYVLNDDLSKTFGEVTWKYKIDELIDKLHNISNELINKGYSKITDESLEVLKIIENCTNCKSNTGKFNLDEIHRLINKIESRLAKLKKEQEEKDNIVDELNEELSKTNNKLNEMLCKGCKEEIKKLADKCENQKLARFLYCANKYNHFNYIRWIPFDEFENTEYLAKGSFGEVHKATWINGGYEEVVLKRIYNSNDKIVDILKEVK